MIGVGLNVQPQTLHSCCRQIDEDFEMRVMTKQTLITTVAERYRDAHQRNGEWTPSAIGSDAPAIYAQLAALPADASEDAIATLIGDNRLTANFCDECGEDRAVTVLLGEEIHHPTDIMAICPDCLKQAKRIAEASSQ